MDSKNQFTVFCLCVAVGIIGGLLYEVFAFLRLIFGCREGKKVVLGGVFDFTFFICFAIFCIFSAYILHFPAFRAYMWLGFGCGYALYLKTLRRIVAFLEKVCYNKIQRIASKVRNKKKLSKSGG